MSNSKQDIAFFEWLFKGGPFPFYKDSVTVPFPINYRPIPVQYISSKAKKITVKVK